MDAYYWDNKIEYLKQSAALYYNDDYIQFLVESVWRLDKPVHILDFGCGFGHMGLRLLPLLPQGSKYTGIDAGSKLIAHGRSLFAELPYDAEFIVCDIHDVPVEQRYDIAICHAVLLHMTEPLRMIEKMVDCVKPGGRVIAFEPHWNSNNASFHFDGIVQSQVTPLGLLQKLFEQDTARTGKDGNIGMKLPLYFNRLGLVDVQCRMSDKVNLYDPAADEGEASMLYEAMKFNHPGDREAFIDSLISRGLQKDEAEQLYEAEKLLSERFTSSVTAAYAAGMKITFGTKRLS